MKVSVDCEGRHDPSWHYVVVDGHGVLVDLTGLGGPVGEPGVARIEWDDQIPVLFPAGVDRATGKPFQAQPAGKVWRRPPGTSQVMATGFTDGSQIAPYVEAWRRQIAKVRGATA
jgi:hypothetical protein